MERNDIFEFQYKLRRVPTTTNSCVNILVKMFDLAELWQMRPPGRNPCKLICRFKMRLRDSKTGPCVVPLPPAVADVLADLLRATDNPWVFPGRKKSTRQVNVSTLWDRIRERAGLDDVRLHDLRHAYASYAIAIGEGLSMIGKLLGHRKVDSTARYAHLLWESIQASSADVDFNPNINAALPYELVTGRFIEERVAVLIAGPCGTGKSHIAQAIGHAAVRQGHDVMFMTQSRLLGTLHAARATDSYERQFQSLAKTPVLIIDDFGLKPLRPPQDEDFHDLVAERYERAATVITSNLDFGEWGDAFPNRLLGAATLDRLRHNAYRVVLDGNSYRSPRPIDKPLAKQAETEK